MKNFLKLALFIILALVIAASILFFISGKKQNINIKNTPKEEKINVEEKTAGNPASSSFNSQRVLKPPVMNAKDRIIKKPFGIKVSPQNSPVQPERFSGYHTGTDFEVTSEELNKEVIVYAICGGEIIQKKRVSGYGNVIAQSCSLENQPVTVLYGHLSFSGSVSVKVGDHPLAGEPVAVLGADKSADTDGERKHLHLSIHKGKIIDYRGYVSLEGDLKNWFNPEEYINFGVTSNQ
jgi:hypothetical protein